VKISLPVISALQDGDEICEIKDYATTSTGDIVYNYSFSIDATTNDLLNNDVVSLRVTLLSTKTSSPTNDFRKLASGDLSPVSDSVGLTISDKKEQSFSKNSTVATSILKSHIQMKQSIRDNKISESLSRIDYAEISVDSIMNADSKSALLEGKTRTAITSGTGDEISLGSRVSDIFFDGDFEISTQRRKNISAAKSSQASDIPVLDTILVQPPSPSARSNRGSSSKNYETDASGNVVEVSGIPNISQSTTQDPLSGILERSGKGSSTPSSIDSSPQAASWTSAMAHGLASSQIIAKDMGSIINSAHDNFAGTSTKFSSDVSGKSALTTDDVDQLAASLRSGLEKIPSVPPSKMSDINGSEYVSVKVDTTTENLIFKTDLSVPSSLLSNPSSFYVVLDLMDTNGRTVQTKTRVIDHAKKVSELYYLTIPPSITAIQSEDSTIRVTLNQMDPSGKKIRLLTKVMDEITFTNGDVFQTVGTYNATHKGDSVSIGINPHPGNTILVRAIAMSSAGALGTFSDVIIKSVSKPPAILLGNELGEPAISSKNILSGIEVSATVMIGSPVAIYFLRKDLTAGERLFTTLSPKSYDAFYRGGKRCQLIDTAVTKDHVYEYKCKLIFKNGLEKISKNSAIILNFKIQDNISIESQTPKIKKISSKGAYSIKVDMKINIPESDADTVKSIFDNLGLSDIFSDEISDIKDELETIAVFSVKRFDFKTGIEHDLGMFPQGLFTDEGDLTKGIPTPDSGGEFLYKFEALIRVPSEALSDVSVKTDPNFSEKFISPIAIRDGTLSYGSSLISNHAENVFELGKTGIVKTVRVTIPSTDSVQINSNKIKVTNKNDVRVSWTVSGNIAKIDHFIILASRNGVTIPVGTHHSSSRGGGFSYVDTSQKNILGMIKYSIVPVFSDFTRGLPSSVGSAVISKEVSNGR